MNKLIDKIIKNLSDPEFWKMLLVFGILFWSAFLFFYFAYRYDFLAKVSGQMAKACREPSNLQAFILFSSPFVLAISFLMSVGELLSQMDLKKNYNKSIKWSKVVLSFSLSIILLSACLSFMVWIC